MCLVERLPPDLMLLKVEQWDECPRWPPALAHLDGQRTPNVSAGNKLHVESDIAKVQLVVDQLPPGSLGQFLRPGISEPSTRDGPQDSNHTTRGSDRFHPRALRSLPPYTF